MLTYDMSQRGNIPMYEYLYRMIRKDILGGKLKAGEKLPSKRNLAENHGVSVITVQNTYEQLITEGYVTAVEKRGYFVERIDTSAAAERKDSIKKEQRHEEKALDMVADFASGKIMYDNFPYTIWARLMRKTLMDREGSFLESPPFEGMQALRKNIAGHLGQFRGLAVNEDNIIVGAGMEYLYGMIIRLIGRSGMIAVEDPGHLKVRGVYESDGIKVLHIPVDDMGMSVEKLRKSSAKAVHLSPSHQFPTGTVMPASRRHSIIRWAIENDSYIIEDDYDSEFRFFGKPVSTMKELEPDRVIYLNTFSRTLSPSVRVAYMVLPDKLMESCRKKLSFFSGTVSAMEQLALAEFIEGGFYGRHLNRMKNSYKKRKSEIKKTLTSSPLSLISKMEGEDAGLHFILRIDADIDDDEYSKKLLERGIRLLPVSAYSARRQDRYKHCFLVSYSDVTKEAAEKAFEIMYKTVEIRDNL